MVSSLDIAMLVAPIIILVEYAYAAFWALNIRRALAVRLYRNQALGIALVAVSLASAVFIGLEIPAPDGLFVVPIFSAFLVMFYWIDTSILAARRSDPLLRDTLHWSQLRILVWALNIGPIIIFSVVFLYFFLLNVTPQSVLDPSFALIGSIIVYTPLLATSISGAIFLPISAHRSKNMSLSKHLKWFGIFMVVLALGFTIVAPLIANDPLLSTVGFSVAVFIGGYCLYRSARSLAPLNRLSTADIQQ